MPYDSRDVDDLLALWLKVDPDPVDVFEDELVRRLGVERHPALSIDEWRRVRVEVIERGEEGHG